MSLMCLYMIRGHIEVHTSMSPRWIGGVCVYFNMISFTVPNSQIALNKRMSTVNSLILFRLDYLPEVVIWAGRQVLILVEAKIRAVFIFDTLVDRAQNSCKTNMNTGLKSRGRLVYRFIMELSSIG